MQIVLSSLVAAVYISYAKMKSYVFVYIPPFKYEERRNVVRYQTISNGSRYLMLLRNERVKRLQLVVQEVKWVYKKELDGGVPFDF